MTQPLQQFGHDESPYERPEEKWVCGRASCGEACSLGPDHKGQCNTIAECVPVRQGDRWVCTRPGAAGGRCAQGPLPDGRCCNPIPPCQPAPSIRARRGSFVRWTIAASIGVLLLGLGGPWSRDVVNPGQLSASHANLQVVGAVDGETSELIDAMTQTACSACHADSDNPLADMLGASMSGGVGPVESERCLSCHYLGSQPLAPHAVRDDVLAALTASAADAEGPAPVMVRMASGLPVGAHRSEAIDCIACHKEHHGRDFDIASITNTQCQTCHSASFASFDAGHPSFSGYPYETPQRIVYDHASHIHTHFPSELTKGRSPSEVPAHCTDCHAPDDQGVEIMVRGYEASCMACHEQEIVGAAPVRFFRLPGVDTRSLAESGRWIGRWPASSDLVTEGPTPFMRLMMAGASDQGGVLVASDRSDLTDLYEADEATLADAEAVVWGVKTLLRDVLVEGQGAVLERVERAVGRELGVEEARALVSGMPRDAMRAMQERWFPDLFLEIAMHRAGRAGVAINELPAIDVDALARSGLWVGAWPDDDARYALATFPHTLGLLMAGDPEVAAAVERLDLTALGELDVASGRVQQDAATLAWGVKDAMYDALAGNFADMHARLEACVGRELDEATARALARSLPLAEVREAQNAWFPQLARDITRREMGLIPEPPAPTEPDEADEQDDGSAMDLFGEDVLGGDKDGADDALDLFGEDVLGDEEADEGGAPDLFGEDALGGKEQESSDGALDLFGGDALGEDAGDEGGAPNLFGEDALGEDEQEGGDGADLFGEDALGGDDDDAQGEAEPIVPEFVSAEDWATEGGWYLDEDTFALVYRIAGHADAFKRGWIDATRRRVLGDGVASDAAERIFNQFTDAETYGSCAKCHAVESGVGETGHVVHWHAVGQAEALTQFTAFAHGPHLTELGDEACLACHEVHDLSERDAAREAGAPTTCFRPLSISNCQSCHGDGGVSDDCLTCHNYHVGVPSGRGFGIGSLGVVRGEAGAAAFRAPSPRSIEADVESGQETPR
jgi:hypothetical protein